LSQHDFCPVVHDREHTLQRKKTHTTRHIYAYTHTRLDANPTRYTDTQTRTSNYKLTQPHAQLRKHTRFPNHHPLRRLFLGLHIFSASESQCSSLFSPSFFSFLPSFPFGRWPKRKSGVGGRKKEREKESDTNTNRANQEAREKDDCRESPGKQSREIKRGDSQKELEREKEKDKPQEGGLKRDRQG
jgi:hypothetical protein